MTTIVFFRNRKSGSLLGFEATGHAGYADAGMDIVCAEISALTQATLNGLKNVLGAPVIYDVDPEEALVTARLMPEATQDQENSAQLLLQTLLEALQAIQRDFPRNVRIIFKEWR